ncbi:type VI secretion system protein TssA [Rugamonas sp. FT82W]|uniref:Type VI secretion system protein TssA n=1 Tax=Duganella vulcania TaxID=2692166 RepID=A0A845G172_9BURK|nr:type VI secretion system protein TssA [Duganella vulcania]MYM87611.1 type VI secretion system protein TssA [Duganella vulcania]
MFSAEQLLIPISDSRPSGEDLSFSSDLDAIAQARKFDDPSLDQGEWVTELKEADWDFVVKRCAALLTEKSKDLRLAVWLTEAAAKQHHLRGLAEGYRLLAGLCEQYWDMGLYPEADGGDNDQRIGNLSWILARTKTLIREMPLTEGRNTAYSAIDFESARKRANGGDDQSGSPKLADMEAAKRSNSAQFCAGFTADAQYCMDALLQLEKVSDAKLGQDSPGFSAARDAVQSMLHAMPAVAGKSGGAETHTADTVDEHPTHTSNGAAAPQQREGVSGPIRNRTQAIAQLRAVAKFFRDTEPHSPVSYFAEKAANAGEQDLHTWLRSVIKDEGSLSHIEEMLGVRPPN